MSLSTFWRYDVWDARVLPVPIFHIWLLWLVWYSIFHIELNFHSGSSKFLTNHITVLTLLTAICSTIVEADVWKVKNGRDIFQKREKKLQKSDYQNFIHFQRLELFKPRKRGFLTITVRIRHLWEFWSNYYLWSFAKFQKQMFAAWMSQFKACQHEKDDVIPRNYAWTSTRRQIER